MQKQKDEASYVVLVTNDIRSLIAVLNPDYHNIRAYIGQQPFDVALQLFFIGTQWLKDSGDLSYLDISHDADCLRMDSSKSMQEFLDELDNMLQQLGLNDDEE